jgi:RNA processing factor Prp31
MSMDLSVILSEDIETQLKNMSMISMGSDIPKLDLSNIQSLCTLT